MRGFVLINIKARTGGKILSMKNKQIKVNQQGFSLPEVMIGTLLLSISLLGLLQYHQALLSSFYQEWHWRQAWRIAQQEAESFTAGRRHSTAISIPSIEWQQNSAINRLDEFCDRLSVEIVTPEKRRAEIHRIYCYGK